MKATTLRMIPRYIILILLSLTLSLPGTAAWAHPSQNAPQLPVVAPASFQGILTATPDALLKSGSPGSSVSFYVSVSTSVNDAISVSTSNTLSWTVNASPNPIDLSTKTADSVELTVDIPPGAKNGEETAVTASFSGTHTADLSTSITMVVRAVIAQATQAPQASRPLVVIESYSMDKDTIVPGDSFNLYLGLKNAGSQDAHNLVFSFGADNFLPQETGGVVALGSIGADGTRDISQRFLVSTTLWGQTNASLSVRLTYTNPVGEVYNETFNLTLAVRGTTAGSKPTATPTVTPTATTAPRPQLVVSGYQSDIDPLQPGSVFTLEMDIQNLGSSDARSITMVLGGGGSNLEPNASGTPQPGGVAGGGSDLSIFAPLGSSNLVFLGDVAPGGAAKTSTKLIVNVSANPGAYALKLSFVYTDPRGQRLVDDQVITLLIFQLPQVEVNFYRDPGPIFAMQPNTLPIQVVNLGRKPTVMGNMNVTAQNADLMNNVMLVGTLDMGGYFPLDVMLIPQAPGPMDINVTISYTDDFNQPRMIQQVVTIEVREGASMGPENPALGPDGMPLDPGMNPDGSPGGMPVVEETFWDKVLRFLKGLVGLDSAQPQQPGMPGEMPPGQEIPAPLGGKG
jgi:hypothetical protein